MFSVSPPRPRSITDLANELASLALQLDRLRLRRDAEAFLISKGEIVAGMERLASEMKSAEFRG